MALPLSYLRQMFSTRINFGLTRFQKSTMSFCSAVPQAASIIGKVEHGMTIGKESSRCMRTLLWKLGR